MQVCTNCGAESREGDKFCTTCGSRLNPVVETTSNGWESPTDTDETRVSPVIVAAEPEETPTEAEPDEPVTSWSWGHRPDENAITEQPKPEPTTSWSFQWSAPTETSETPDVPEIDVTSDVDDFLEAAEAEIDIPDDPVIDVEAEPVVEPDDAPTPKERAQALLFELRELVDESFGESDTAARPPQPALDTLNAVQGDDGKFDNLRSILENAREQPRDVDTMLNLLSEIDTIIALIDSHERLVAAVDTAKAQLA